MASEAKHTPGPWHVEAKTSGVFQVKQELRGSDWLVATVAVRDESEANARLIAAAPDLLGALDRLAHDCSNIGNPLVRDKIANETLPQARAAIAKATGA